MVRLKKGLRWVYGIGILAIIFSAACFVEAVAESASPGYDDAQVDMILLKVLPGIDTASYVGANVAMPLGKSLEDMLHYRVDEQVLEDAYFDFPVFDAIPSAPAPPAGQSDGTGNSQISGDGGSDGF